MFAKILIANRGEIARRIQHTCRRLGVPTVAVYSSADAGAGFVANADQAVPIGAAPATQSYLQQQRLIDAALASGAEAVHPGYGFLAENADFARAVSDAGLTFIGPAAKTIALMGSKTAAKRAMESAGVACVPGYHGDDQDDGVLLEAATRIGFPVLIKASAGGGGKGMRVAHHAGELADALAGARREAQSAFGDDQLLVEKFVDRPRHIEVQVFGDSQGRIVHLFERECSIQRRYQKIIEEAPSPFVTDALREQLTAAAVRAAQAVDYRNAGTVEFIVSAAHEFYFMEMNTRLQVEHPVTEMICGVDLVEWQLRVAAGEPLPLEQSQLTRRGHAIEARVYAEDPFQDFLPSSGTIETFACNRRGGLRVDADLQAGQEISVFYDPMIAKLSLHAGTREAARAALARALDDVALFGPATNLPLLRLLLAHDDFREARMDTGYLDRHLSELLGAAPGVPPEAVAAAALAEYADAGRDPWRSDGWQANGQSERRFAFRAPNGEPVNCQLHGQASTFDFLFGEHSARVEMLRAVGERLHFRLDDAQYAARIRRYGAWRKIDVGDRRFELATQPLYAYRPDGSADAGHPGSPMPGRIVKLFVSAGDRVDEGQALVVLEGMKMEFTVRAAIAGVVESVLFAEGDQVDAEVPLVDLAPALVKES